MTRCRPKPALGRRYLIRLLPLITFVHAQTPKVIDSSKLPACVVQCTTLIEAERLCLPPVAPQANQGAYQDCFCNSNFLVPWRDTPQGVCQNCPASDLEQGQSWFLDLCNGGKVVVPASNDNGDDSAGNSGSSSGNSTPSKKKSKKEPSWISEHYRWVIMLIVLILAAIGGTLFGIWLKRRSKRKKAGMHRESVLARSDAAHALRERHPAQMGGPTSSPPQSMSQLNSFTSLPGLLIGPPGSAAGPTPSRGSMRGTPGTAASGAAGMVGEDHRNNEQATRREPPRSPSGGSTHTRNVLRRHSMTHRNSTASQPGIEEDGERSNRMPSKPTKASRTSISSV